MKNQHCRLVVVCLLCISVINLCSGQISSQKTLSQETQNVAVTYSADGVSHEERLIRSTYEKLTMYNLAAQLHEAEGNKEPADPHSVLKFELRDFRIGPVDEILGTLYKDLVTLSSGDIIKIHRARTRENTLEKRGEERVEFKAAWTTGQYASMYDRRWTIGDAFQIEAGKYQDVGKYASYEVTVSFKGNARTYRALVLFRSAYRSSENLKPIFWDSVVGLGGVLTNVWEEKRLPYEPKRRYPSRGRNFSGANADGRSASDSATSIPEEGVISASFVGSAFTWISRDDREHESGDHLGTAVFTPECVRVDSMTQRCQVNLSNIAAHESGVTNNLVYTHVGKVDEETETMTAGLGATINCKSAVGVGFSNCLFENCSFTVTVGFSGNEATVSGGDLWNTKTSSGNQCNLQPGGGGGGGGKNCNCGPSLLQPLSVSSDGGEIQPYMTCDDPGCNLSPVIIDVAGNGFSLTDAAGGVRFDFDGDGAREGLSWTAATSDDAFACARPQRQRHDRRWGGTLRQPHAAVVSAARLSGSSRVRQSRTGRQQRWRDRRQRRDLHESQTVAGREPQRHF